jgi:hypothetical protein
MSSPLWLGYSILGTCIRPGRLVVEDLADRVANLI